MLINNAKTLNNLNAINLRKKGFRANHWGFGFWGGVEQLLLKLFLWGKDDSNYIVGIMGMDNYNIYENSTYSIVVHVLELFEIWF